MENMVMNNLFGGVYCGKRVLITGHTGFKGSWLSLWLTKMGANVTGYALSPPTVPNHIDLLGLDINSVIADIRDIEMLRATFQTVKPEIIFHLAAQPIVRTSYSDPVETFSCNVMGTINVFEAARTIDSVKAFINVTSDKCYENREWVWGYRETDSLGGYDPYSTSKACAELVANCWRNSFFNMSDYGKIHRLLLASCRSGNVIGGGDWATDRLIPDIIRSVSNGRKVLIRNPNAVRPWQHVLEPLSGYLMLGKKLLDGDRSFAEAWNFGPNYADSASVGRIVECVKEFWPDINYESEKKVDYQLHEAGTLKLDSSKSRIMLNWVPIWGIGTTIKKTTEWYMSYYNNKNINSNEDLEDYITEAKIRKVSWAIE